MTKLTTEKLINLKLLLSIERIGPARIRTLLNKFRTIENILSADPDSLISIEGINTNLANRITKARFIRKEIEEKTKNEIDNLNKINANIITVWDEEYPPILKKIYDPPLLIYTIGKFDDKDKYSISIVGTRTPTPYGKIQTESIVRDLSAQGITITSGMARGIDSIAHASALKAGGRTIAVIGSGLDVIYPPENRRLFEKIAENGAIISEFPLGTKPDAQNFPRRNRIISGLSLGTVVMETGNPGGAMQTAKFGLDQNREIFALPGNVGIKQSEGTNILIQRGEAKLITNAEDILIELELKIKPVISKKRETSKVEMNLFEEKIVATLNNEPLQIDKIALATNLSSSDCLVHLLSLEFKGLVKQLPGKMFVLI
jgi:DNA processing protein